MGKIEVATEIDAPAERVWEILMDFGAYPDWNPFVSRLAGEIREGGTLDALMRLGERELPAEVTVERVVPDRELAWSGGLRPRFLMSAVHVFRIEPLGSRRVRFVQEEIFHGLLSPIFLGWMGRELESQFRRMNEALGKRAAVLRAEEA